MSALHQPELSSRVRFAHLSDPHLPIHSAPTLGALLSKRVLGWMNWKRSRQHHHRAEILETITQDIAAQSPDIIALTGDIANIALPAEFDDALCWMMTLGTAENVMVVPGNHDTYVPVVWEQGLGKFAPYMQGFREGDLREPTGFGDFPYLRTVGPVHFIGLNSAPSTLPGMATGAIDREQLVRLEGLLNHLQGDGRLKIIMLHHPIVPGVVKQHKALRDEASVTKILAKAEIDLIIHGHAHYPCFEALQALNGKIPHIGVASASYAGKGEKPDAQGYRPAAQYHLYTVEKSDAGFTLELEVRGLDLASGQVTSLRHMKLI